MANVNLASLAEDWVLSIGAIPKQVEEGNMSAMDALILLKQIEKAAKGVQSTVVTDAVSEFEDYGERTVTKDGFSVKKYQRATYVYSHDPVFSKMEKEIKAHQELMKKALELEEQGLSVSDGEGVIATPARKVMSNPTLTIGRD